ncbi:hypothetical protein TTHT_0143 [Thermotomaculum hydrothermale]|uniref:Uncharacterized protein n=1 Tax=Thermotomaculum hydrothermale TaxID=981385 RepID=A0A7R6SXS0_9BACT|nr:hypothetical protein [Thermotomaculum hydrothermale]BBB31786.1 hypothetical protein TTHT_0143 [Thermotomaculum hydrothermale]
MEIKGFVIDASSMIILDKAGAMGVLSSHVPLISTVSIKKEFEEKSEPKEWFKNIKWRDTKSAGDKSIQSLIIRNLNFALLSDDFKLLEYAENHNKPYTSAIAIPAFLYLNEVIHKETAIILFERIHEIGYYSDKVISLAWSFFDRNLAPEWF